jgi:ergothioneine biosynthesis protein EgtB
MSVAAFETSVRADALARFRAVRAASEAMCAPLSAEEYRIQPVADVSPPWWNLGHTSWFFARNVLGEFGGERTAEDENYDYLLNSYYASLGQRLPRDKRGSISRPSTDEIYAYRHSVDRRVAELLETCDDERLQELLPVLTIGIQHEQQHQELFVTEIKFIRYQNPPDLREPLTTDLPLPAQRQSALEFREFEGGLLEFGNLDGDWCWDNELPVHRFYLEPFALADRLITSREYLEFMEDGGYDDPLLWLDNGWHAVQAQAWRAPLYWERTADGWWNWTLAGMRPVALDEPVSHVSFYEADAFARWRANSRSGDADLRLPGEREWEHAARSSGDLGQMAGCLWQWTASYYEPYPGYQPFGGALAEYNGKFMDNQRVLRGGSIATPAGHYRPSYRNFWPAETRFQFTGIRLARSL